MKKKETINNITYDVLEINDNKLRKTQILKELQDFIKNKKFSKVKIEYIHGGNFPITITTFFKNGKKHNEFGPAVETISLTDIVNKYFLDGKEIKYDGNNWNEYVTNYKRYLKLKETLK
jgi:hypothetical protein